MSDDLLNPFSLLAFAFFWLLDGKPEHNSVSGAAVRSVVRGDVNKDRLLFGIRSSTSSEYRNDNERSSQLAIQYTSRVL